jgi:cyclopropane fatty-acyl-phospholipid synthase-like methyltransferase
MRDNHGHHPHHTDEGHAHHHSFDDPSAFAQRLDAPERDDWQKPEEVIASFQLRDDATVAEIGAGTGYFVVRLASYLANGTVIGLDAQPQMVEYLRQRAAELGLTNVDARLVQPADALPLTEQLDLLLCVDTYHHIADRIALFSRYAKHLKRGGKLVIIDRAIDAPEGPPAEMRLSTENVQAELAQAGFALVAEMNFLLPYQFYLAFTPTVTA